MAFVTINTARNAQDAPISQDWGNDVVNDLNYLFAQSSNTVDADGAPIVPNGSFELDANNSTTVTGWTVSLGTGATGIVTNSDQNHGAQSFKFTRDTTAGHNGGSLTSNFMNVSPSLAYQVCFMNKNSEADVENTVQISWYTSSQSLISTTTIYDSNLGSNAPTTWTCFTSNNVVPPATAMFCKIILNAGIAAQTPAGTTSIFFDGVFMKLRTMGVSRTAYTATTSITIPSGVFHTSIDAYIKNRNNFIISFIFFEFDCKPGDSLVITFPAPSVVNQTPTITLNGTTQSAISTFGGFNIPTTDSLSQVLVRY